MNWMFKCWPSGIGLMVLSSQAPPPAANRWCNLGTPSLQWPRHMTSPHEFTEMTSPMSPNGQRQWLGMALLAALALHALSLGRGNLPQMFWSSPVAFLVLALGFLS